MRDTNEYPSSSGGIRTASSRGVAADLGAETIPNVDCQFTVITTNVHNHQNKAEIGARLREERQRLLLTQAEFGALGAVTKTTQMNYESGHRSPDAGYLAAIEASGVDVLFIITGRREAHGSGDTPARTVPWLSPVPESEVGVHESPALYATTGLCLTSAWLQRRKLSPEHLRALLIRGAAMQPTLWEGDVTLVDVSDVEPRSGYMFALRLGVEVLVRCVQFVPGGKLRVWASSTMDQPFEVDRSSAKDFAVLGRIVGVLHDF